MITKIMLIKEKQEHFYRLKQTSLVVVYPYPLHKKRLFYNNPSSVKDI